MGIPNMSLPELRPAQIENPMDQYAKALQLRQMQQQGQMAGVDLQQKQQALKDQQAMTSAMHSWDGKDYDALLPLVIKNGASANAVIGLKQHLLEQQEKKSIIAKNDAETGGKNVETIQKKNDMINGAIGGLLDLPDDQLQAGTAAKAQELAQNGLLDQQHLQAVQNITQLPPAQMRDQLKILQKSNMLESQQWEKAKADAQAFKDTQQGLKDQAVVASGGAVPVDRQVLNAWLNTKEQNGKTRAENGKTAVDFEQAKETKTETTSSDLFGTNTTHHTAPSLAAPAGSPANPSAQPKAAIVPPAKASTTAPPKNISSTPIDIDPSGRKDAALQGLKASDAAEIKGLADYRINPQLFARRPGVLGKVLEYDPTFDQQRYQLKQKTRQYFITGKGADEVQAFNTAQQHADLLQKSFDALNNGDMPSINAIKNSFASAFGSGAPVSTKAIIDAYNHEVNTAIAKGHTTDHEIADRKLTLSPNASPEQVKDVLNGYKALMQSKIRIRMNQYEAGLRGEPSFGQAAPGQQQPNAPASGGGFNWDNHPVVK